ncbi:hypothetical protein EYF80_065707 [Liparis tanakae]|uniref:Uncharacterized protein n=1 Tax=Liparis tanakae TaxID=230148 RepID=A0A4Z2E6F0_9TELE|nr:hypothetical protein EYF80_065707 [Liparis tanakae]
MSLNRRVSSPELERHRADMEVSAELTQRFNSGDGAPLGGEDPLVDLSLCGPLRAHCLLCGARRLKRL